MTLNVEFKPIEQLKLLLYNFAFAGLAVFVGILLLYFLRLFSTYLGDTSRQVILAFPVFPLALMGSFFVRFSLEKLEKQN